jgi:hypothetical protein
VEPILVASIAWGAGVLLSGYRVGQKTVLANVVEPVYASLGGKPGEMSTINWATLITALLPIITQLIGCDVTKAVKPTPPPAAEVKHPAERIARELSRCRLCTRW